MRTDSLGLLAIPRRIYSSFSRFPLKALPLLSQCAYPTRFYSTEANSGDNTIIDIHRANVYRFGQANAVSEPVFRDLEWTVKGDESWAIVGPAGSEKSDLLSMLMGHMRLSPSPPKGLYPFLSSRSPPVDPYDQKIISSVSFTSRPSFASSFSTAGANTSSGGFFDYTARYGAMRDELRTTLRETLFSQVQVDDRKELEEIVERLDLKDLMDLPFVVLSNGQARRARVAKALLGKPELLLLDEPLTGLDTAHRPQLTSLLHDLHVSQSPRILMALRLQDPLPDWITHVALVEGQTVKMQKRNTAGAMPFPVVTSNLSRKESEREESERERKGKGKAREGKELVVMKGVNVKYHDRHVLRNINWTVREGEKWHLQGPNGSGKTTLTSLLLGTHPQSYSLPSTSLTLFSKPRRLLPTVTLQQLIGHASPEIFNAFPRRGGENGMTVREVIGTGFEGVFSYRALNEERGRKVDKLIAKLGPSKWQGASGSESGTAVNSNEDKIFAETKFTSLPPAHQSLTLLLRALVSHPPLLILDEPFAGMDSKMIDAIKRYLRERLDEEEEEEGGRKTSVVFISHWEDELPWEPEDVRRIKLVDGEAVIS